MTFMTVVDASCSKSMQMSDLLDRHAYELPSNDSPTDQKHWTTDVLLQGRYTIVHANHHTSTRPPGLPGPLGIRDKQAAGAPLKTDAYLIADLTLRYLP